MKAWGTVTLEPGDDVKVDALPDHVSIVAGGLALQVLTLEAAQRLAERLLLAINDRRYREAHKCPGCDGSGWILRTGARDEDDRVECPTCGGFGLVEEPA